MKPITRRSVTTGLAAVVTAIPAVGTFSKSASSDLTRLIKEHRVAYRAFCKAITREEKMNGAYKKAHTDKTTVLCLLGGGYSLSSGYEFCQENIASAYRNQRDRLPQLTRVAPDLAEQFRSVMDAKEAENMDVLDRTFAEEEARKEAFGLARAERELEATGEAELEAAIAVCAYPCATLEQVRLKAEYLAKAPGLSDGLQEEQVEALLQSFSGATV
jgi:hypothetical protein